MNPFDNLDHIDREILRYLYSSQGWVNTNQVSSNTGIAWLTAEKHLELLNKKGYVVRGHSNNTAFWKINYGF